VASSGARFCGAVHNSSSTWSRRRGTKEADAVRASFKGGRVGCWERVLTRGCFEAVWAVVVPAPVLPLPRIHLGLIRRVRHVWVTKIPTNNRWWLVKAVCAAVVQVLSHLERRRQGHEEDADHLWAKTDSADDLEASSLAVGVAVRRRVSCEMGNHPPPSSPPHPTVAPSPTLTLCSMLHAIRGVEGKRDRRTKFDDGGAGVLSFDE
jgi:hypothetical protein